DSSVLIDVAAAKEWGQEKTRARRAERRRDAAAGRASGELGAAARAARARAHAQGEIQVRRNEDEKTRLADVDALRRLRRASREHLAAEVPPELAPFAKSDEPSVRRMNPLGA